MLLSSRCLITKFSNSINISLSSLIRASSTSTTDSKGLFGGFFDRAPIPASTTTHPSQTLASRDVIIELQTHNVRPELAKNYASAHRNLSQFFDHKNDLLHCEALGSFNVIVGDEDQYIHLWRYDDGFAGIDQTLDKLRNDEDFQKLRNELVKSLRSRHNQFLLPFSFWPSTERREGGHIYELRSYHLKPGTMVEWGNYWARAIRMRDYKNEEAYVGLFSQVGELYNVKHVWCYKSLQERREAREVVWQKQQSQWGEIVAKTVPLVRTMTSRIMLPMEHSFTN